MTPMPPTAPWPATRAAHHALAHVLDTMDAPPTAPARLTLAAAHTLTEPGSGLLAAFAALLPDDLTPDEAEALADGLTHSSVPDALATMLDTLRAR